MPRNEVFYLGCIWFQLISCSDSLRYTGSAVIHKKYSDFPICHYMLSRGVYMGSADHLCLIHATLTGPLARSQCQVYLPMPRQSTGLTSIATSPRTAWLGSPKDGSENPGDEEPGRQRTIRRIRHLQKQQASMAFDTTEQLAPPTPARACYRFRSAALFSGCRDSLRFG